MSKVIDNIEDINAIDSKANIANPTFTGTVNATTATNLANGSAGTIPYQSASGTTAQLTAGTSGQFLKSNGASAPSWVTASEVIGLTDLNNVTIATPTSGQALTFNGTSWVNSAVSASDATKMPLSGGSFTGLVATAGNSLTFNSANDTTLSIRSSGTGTPATMSFHRPGAYAINFGLDTDNVLKAGGWSAGSSYPVMLDTAHTFAVNGYQRFSNGLIIQWATQTQTASNNHITWTFPIAFTSACVLAYCMKQSTGDGSGLNAIYAQEISTTSVNFYEYNSTNAGQTRVCYAIGY